MSEDLSESSGYESIGILMVATNRYLERWKDVALDIEMVAFRNAKDVTIHLFTNLEVEALSWGKEHLRKTKLIIHKIPGWGWPEATLLRYEFFQGTKNNFNEDLLMYLDSDMRIVRDPEDFILSKKQSESISVVSHPGYYRPRGKQLIKLYLRNPRIMGTDFRSLVGNGRGLGAWEDNKNSLAYVPRKHRKIYVHGAIWFGNRETFLDLCEKLTKRTRDDLEKGIIAKWHDESHLNWFISQNNYNLIDNRMSWVLGYRNLAEYEKTFYISNVQKSSGEGREPSNA